MIQWNRIPCEQIHTHTTPVCNLHVSVSGKKEIQWKQKKTLIFRKYLSFKRDRIAH